MYYEDVKDKSLEDLYEDVQFQNDLITFFKSRYNYTDEELVEAGGKKLYSEFAEHMRWQEVNEATALRDLWFVKDTRNNSEDDIAAFGRLMKAWDNSSTAGEMSWQKAGDYFGAVVSSPSTIAGILTAGVGTGLSKVASKAGTKGLSLAIRGATIKPLANRAAIEAAKEGTVSAVVRGAVLGTATETALAYGHESVLEETKETSQGEIYAYDPTKFWLTVGLSGAMGSVTGGASRYIQVHKTNEALDKLAELHTSRLGKVKEASDLARLTLQREDLNADDLDKLKLTLTDFIELRKAESETAGLRPLDEDAVKEGDRLWKTIVETDDEIAAGFDAKTLRRIAAAGVDIVKDYREKLAKEAGVEAGDVTLDPKIRVTEILANGVAEGRITGSYINELKSKYQISDEQLGYLIMADMSNAGRTLAVASNLKRLSSTTPEALAKQAAALLKDGIFSIDDEALRRLERSLARQGDSGSVSPIWKIAAELDSLRISMLTSQFGTTAANVVSSAGRVGVDMTDQFFKNLLTDYKKPFRGVFDVLAGMTWKKQDSELMALMLFEEAPDLSKRIFKSAARLEDAVDSNSALAKFSRGINFMNTAVDGVFKSAVFYASINRQLREAGTSFDEFIKKNDTLANLNPRILVKAKEDALGFTFQKGFENDPSAYGQAASAVIRTARRFPFTITSVMPFPRYIANQLEFIHDYTPLLSWSTAAYEKLSGNKLSTTKTITDRLATGTTGLLLLGSAYMLRAGQKGETGPTEFIDPTDKTPRDLERWGGPWNTTLVVADAMYRWNNGMNPPNLGEAGLEAFEKATGVAALGYSGTLLDAVIQSVQQGKWSTSMNREMADFLSTFTYPIATLKDVYNQFDPEGSAYTPYTRWFAQAENETDVMGKISILGLWEKDAELLMRMTRFMPDTAAIDYVKQFNGNKDLPIYDPFSGTVVMEYSPAIKQFTGQRQTGPLTALEKDMNYLRIKKWNILGSTEIKNPLLDYTVRYAMAQYTPQLWEAKKAEMIADGTWDSMTDKEKSVRLTEWLNGIQRAETKRQEENYTEWAQANPVQASGYVRHMYLLQEQELSRKGVDFDFLARFASEGAYETADEWLDSSDNVSEEINRRMFLLQLAGKNQKDIERIWKEKYPADTLPEMR